MVPWMVDSLSASSVGPRNMAPSLTGICRINDAVHFWTGYTIFGEIWSKSQNSHFKVKLDT